MSRKHRKEPAPAHHEMHASSEQEPPLRGSWHHLADYWTCDKCAERMHRGQLVFKADERGFCATCGCSDEMPGSDLRAAALARLIGKPALRMDAS